MHLEWISAVMEAGRRRVTALTLQTVALALLCGIIPWPIGYARGAEISPATASAGTSVSTDGGAALEARLHEQWKAKVKGLDLSQVRGINVSNATMRTTVGALSADEFELLCAWVKAMPMSTMTPFQKDMLAFAAMRMANRGERARLVDLLSERCPRAIPPAPIEFTLAAEERRRKLPDGFTVLVDAYREARNEEARTTLLDAMAAAMPSLRARTPDDAAFVAAVEAWHASRRGELPPLRSQYVFAWQDHRFVRGAEELFETP